MLGEAPIELGMQGREREFLRTLRQDPIYEPLFRQAFPRESTWYTLDQVTKAIAQFERSIVSMRSPYDLYRWGGDPSAISESAKRGELIFFSSERGGCFHCHAGWNFSAPIQFEGSQAAGNLAGFFNTGVSAYEAPNRGLYEQTHRPEDIGKFRTPSLRNIAVTAPYMHDGSLATLEQVIDHYVAGGKMEHTNKSRILHPLTLSADEKRDLIDFLMSLTDPALLHDSRWSDPWSKARR